MIKKKITLEITVSNDDYEVVELVVDKIISKIAPIANNENSCNPNGLWFRASKAIIKQTIKTEDCI